MAYEYIYSYGETRLKHKAMYVQVVFVVAIWWIGNVVATIASKYVMNEDGGSTKVGGGTQALNDFRWLDLTFMQHLLGGVVVFVWISIVRRRPFLPSEINVRTLVIAGVGNAVGNLATNASYAAVSSVMTQAIKSFEPIFTFTLFIFVNQSFRSFTLQILASIILMSVGVCMFVVGDTSFNLWGVIAALCANMGFPVRDVYLKRLSDTWESPLQKYGVMSLCSVVPLLPLVIVKLLVTHGTLNFGLQGALVSSTFHFVYNTASITVLKSVDPVTHAILNLCKRVFVILANVIYFSSYLSLVMAVGLILLIIGLYLYSQKSKDSQTNSYSLQICFALIVMVVLLFLFQSSSSISKRSTRTNSKPHLNKSPSTPIPQPPPSNEGKPVEKDIVHMAWVYQQPLPKEFLMNVNANSKLLNGFPITVYCGSTQCVKDVEIIDSARITVRFLNLVELMNDTPLENWLSQHVIHKVLTGAHYEDHLNEAVKFSLLWKYGGIYVDPSIVLLESIPIKSNVWISKDDSGMIKVSRLSVAHPMLEMLMNSFVSNYPGLESTSTNDWPLVYNIQYNFKDVSKHFVNKSVDLLNVMYHSVSFDRQKVRDHFATLSYQDRVSFASQGNLGDEMQNFPGLQFVPFVDRFIDREKIIDTAGTEPVTIFFNAWWGSRSTSWPPPPNVHPVLVSLHAGDSIDRVWPEHIEYFKEREPIGSRDTATLKFFRDRGIETFFSGCATLTIRNPNLNKPRAEIYFIDVKRIDLLPPEIVERAIVIPQGFDKNSDLHRYSLLRFAQSYENLLKYSTAKVIVTQRIHAALPCVAMGTPVVFINSAHLPGGGGSSSKSSDRIGGLLQFFHTFNLYDNSDTKAKEDLKNFNWNNPPPNPNVASFRARKATFWNILRENPVFYDTAKRYNLLPFSTPLFMGSSEDFVFHVSYEDDVNKLSLRSVESVFHHHPSAKVIVHSQTAKQEDFIVFTESGFTVEVTSEAVITDLWNDESKELLNELYNDGGVVMSSNVILLRPLSIQESIILSPSLSESSSFAKFSAGDETLKSIIEERKKDFKDNKTIKVLQDRDIHDIQQEQCSSKEKQQSDGQSIAVLSLSAVGLEKVAFDNLCKRILNSFCVLCNRIF